MKYLGKFIEIGDYYWLSGCRNGNLSLRVI